MKRKLTAFIIAVANISLWSVPAPAGDFYRQASPLQYPGGYSDPALYWPETAHEPALSKTLNTVLDIPVQETPAPAYNYDWQNQPALTVPTLPLPQFSYPQQGYYPREEIQPQIAPGYEYDFGGTGSYPPAYPIEGAKWKAPHEVGLGHETHEAQFAPEYAHCPL